MKLEHIAIHPAMTGFIDKIWIFQSKGRVPRDDMKLIVPNGLIKLVIPFRNGLSGKMDGCYHLSKENQMTVIGICDLPSIVDGEHDVASGTIGVEFSPLGAYRFFKLHHREIKNQIHPLADILGRAGREIEEKISNAGPLESKVKILQDFLLTMFRQTESDLIFEYCVKKIRHTKGGISVRELEKQTGYSSRWLNMKFLERIGISPKNLCSITRFQFFYQSFAQGTRNEFMKNDFHQLYYDQAHFIKEFKRFTGLPPTKFENQVNDFGKIFYKD